MASPGPGSFLVGLAGREGLWQAWIGTPAPQGPVQPRVEPEGPGGLEYAAGALPMRPEILCRDPPRVP